MQSITTKYIGATNSKPSRIKATSSSGKSVTLSYSYESLDNEQQHDRVAMALCDKLDWQGPLMRGETKTGFVYVFDAHANRVRFDSLSYVLEQAGK